MATIIDSLIVSLGIDKRGFDAGRAQVKRDLKDTSDAANKTQKSFDGVASSAIKFLAIIGGTAAIKHFVDEMVESNAALGRFAQNLELAVENVSALSNAAELAGGSAEGLQGTLDLLSKTQTELQLTGQSGLIPYFSALGVAIADVQGRARPVDDLLLDLADRFSGMDRTTAFNMGRMMGIDPGTMNLLLKGRAEIELMMRRQREQGVVTKQQAEQAQKLREQMILGRQAFATLGREILTAAGPAIEWFTGILQDAGNWMRDNKEFVKDFLSILAIGLTAVAVAVTPINLTAVAVTALAGAIALLYQDYQTWKRGGDSLIDWTKWEAGLNLAKIGITAFRNFMSDAFYRIFAAADAAKSALSGDWGHAKWAWNEALTGNTSPSATAVPTVSASPSTSSSIRSPRGVRNNNPGNLNFAGQAGATKESGVGGRFAVFRTMREGVAALVRQIGLYIKRGKNTIRQIIETYAPKLENNTAAYIAAVSQALGISPDTPLDVNDSNTLSGLVRAIVDHEQGRGQVSDSDISAGIQLARGIPGASKVAQGAGASVSAPRVGGNVDNSSQVSIGEIKVYTNATDANGIANDMGKSMNYLFASQANNGLQ